MWQISILVHMFGLVWLRGLGRHVICRPLPQKSLFSIGHGVIILFRSFGRLELPSVFHDVSVNKHLRSDAGVRKDSSPYLVLSGATIHAGFPSLF